MKNLMKKQKPKYNSLSEINSDLQRYKSEQKSASKNINYFRSNIKQAVKPINLIKNSINSYGKLNLVFKILKKIIK